MTNCRKGSGNAKATTRHESEKLFEFADVKPNDVFYDLGSGFGTPCIIAVEKFKLKKVVGIEFCESNYLEATKRIMKKGLTDKIWLWNDTIENVDFNDATFVYYLLESDFKRIKHIEKMLKKKNCRIVTPIPIPSFKPSKIIKIGINEFYLTKCPLKKHRSRNPDDWAQSIPKKMYHNFEDYCVTYSKQYGKKDELYLRKLMKKLYK